MGVVGHRRRYRIRYHNIRITAISLTIPVQQQMTNKPDLQMKCINQNV